MKVSMEKKVPLDPLVSIVLPTFNRAGLIGETIESVLRQTYPTWELLIIDDGSADHTDRIVAGYTDERIRYSRMAHTGKLGAVRNCGIRKAKGDYIAFLDSDDLWRADKLSVQLSLAEQYPRAAFLFSNGDQFGEGAITPPEQEALFFGNVFEKVLLNHQLCIYMPSFMFRRHILEKVGYLREDLISGCDIDFFFRTAYHFDAVFTNDRLVRIRKHGQSTSAKLGFLPYLDHIEIYRSFYERQWLTKSQFNSLTATLYYKMALDQRRYGLRGEAVRSFLKHNIRSPLNWKGWVRLLQTILIPARIQ
jgi:glycosyltransferase involved in cell wall biosynthesis